MRVLRFLHAQWLILGLTLLVGIVYGSHHLFISRELTRQGLAYEPVTLAGNRDEGAFYGHRVRAVFEGQWLAGDVSVQGNEKSPAMLPLLNPALLGGLARVVGSPSRAFIVSDFFFPALIFFILYLLANELTGNKRAAVFFAVVFIFMPKVFLALPPISPTIFRDFVSAIAPDPQNLSYFSRFEYPKITFVFFAFAFYLIVRALKRQEKYSALWAGIAFGVLFYTYLYDWVYVLIGLTLMGVIFLYRKEYDAARRLAAILGIGLVVSVPYWMNFSRLIALPHYHDLSNRIGSEIGRGVRFVTAWKTYVRSAVLMVLVWFLWRKRDRLTAWFLLGLLPVIAIVLNLQVVLGFNPQPDHWHRVQFLVIGLSFLVLGLWLYERYCATPARRRLLGITGGILMALMFGSALYSQYAFSAVQANRFTVSKERRESYVWLNAKTPKRSVVGSISIANSELPLYTHNKLFLPNGFNTTVSDAEIWDRFMITARVFGLGVQEFKTLLGETDTVLYLFHDEYRDRLFDSYFGTSDHIFPDEVIVWAETQYGKYLDLPVTDLAKKYQLDYLYVSEEGVGKDPIDVLPSIEKMYDNDGVRIYKVLRNASADR